ncbi:hypothetical protein J4Q44_G00330440 [Coregonus suidteri]|uniref:Apolipoprotein A-I n=2 Tax=Coregonus TaxID=27772 RepID=A0AAN8QPL2_9TELE
MVLRSCCKFGPVLVWFRLGYVALLWLCVTHLRCARAETKTVVQKDAEFDVTYNDTVTSDNQTIYAFNHTVSRNKTEGVRVTVDVLSEGAESSPILFVVRQKQAVLSFQVPLILRGLYQRKYPYAHVGRTLCQPPTRTLTETQYFFVDVSTLSSLGTQYQLRISRVDSFTLHTDKKFSFTASPSQPQYFKYVFPDGVDTVIVKVNSEMTFPCSVMSIQDIQCPVYDLDNNVAFIGMYQTMTKTAAITVQRKDFPSNSFYVVVVVKTEDEACDHCTRLLPVRRHQTTIMKFLALALTILLAAGTQAVPMQADAPSQLEHVKAAMMVYMTQVKETAQRSIDLLDDTEYKEYKQQLSQSLDNLQQYAQSASQSLAPYSEAFGTQLTDATAAVRAEVMKDVEELRTQLEPKRAELKAVLEKHMEEYREKLEPLIKEHIDQRRTEMEAFRVKMEPVVEEMRAKVSANVEETKAKLMPIVETVRAKLTERLEELRTLAAPYAEEYKEQMIKAVEEVREKVVPLTEDFKGQVGPAAEQARLKLMSIYETIIQAMKA